MRFDCDLAQRHSHSCDLTAIANVHLALRAPPRTTTETGARRGWRLDSSTATPGAVTEAIRLSAPRTSAIHWAIRFAF